MPGPALALEPQKALGSRPGGFHRRPDTRKPPAIALATGSGSACLGVNPGALSTTACSNTGRSLILAAPVPCLSIWGHKQLVGLLPGSQWENLCKQVCPHDTVSTSAHWLHMCHRHARGSNYGGDGEGAGPCGQGGKSLSVMQGQRQRSSSVPREPEAPLD